MKSQKSKFLILIALLLTLLVACGGGDKGNSGASGASNELVVGVTSFEDTLEPTDQYFSWVVTRYGIGENLKKFDEKGNLQQLLA